MLYVGLDVHLRTSSIHVLSDQGMKVKSYTVRGPWKPVVASLGTLQEPFLVCFEASCGYGTLYDALSKVANRVVVAHPGHLRLIFRSKRKNDRIDAERLARLLYLDQVPEIHVPRIEVRDWRSLIELRQREVNQQIRCKNRLRALLRHHGVILPKGGKWIWTKAGRAWLSALEWPTESSRMQCSIMLASLAGAEELVHQVTRHLDELGGQHSGVELLRTIPGVGPRTAEAVLAYLDDAHRFERVNQVGSYFGLVPSQDASGGMNRLGHLTKNGPSTVRRLLIEAVWQSVRLDGGIRGYFERLHRGKKDRRKIALVATAHKLLRSMHAMLRTGETWSSNAWAT